MPTERGGVQTSRRDGPAHARDQDRTGERGAVRESEQGARFLAPNQKVAGQRGHGADVLVRPAQEDLNPFSEGIRLTCLYGKAHHGRVGMAIDGHIGQAEVGPGVIAVQRLDRELSSSQKAEKPRAASSPEHRPFPAWSTRAAPRYPGRLQDPEDLGSDGKARLLARATLGLNSLYALKGIVKQGEATREGVGKAMHNLGIAHSGQVTFQCLMLEALRC